MTKEQLRMQMLAGIITESQYKAELEEENGQFKSLNMGKLSTLFQMLASIPANSSYHSYNMDTGETTSGKDNIVANGYATPEFFQRLKKLQDGLQRGDKEAGQEFKNSIKGRYLYLGKRFMPFRLYGGEKDLFMPADYRALDELNDALDDVYRVVQFTSKYEDNNINAANPEWNNLVDAVNELDLNDFKDYAKKYAKK
jgi:hypothetical protein